MAGRKGFCEESSDSISPYFPEVKHSSSGLLQGSIYTGGM